MYSPVINFALQLVELGLPLAILFLLFFIASLCYKRARAFAGWLIVGSVGVGIVTYFVMWNAVYSTGPYPYNYVATWVNTLFAFGASGFVLFFLLLWKSKRETAKQLG